ncbi:MAG: hypothetical protein ACHQWU_04935 [Gemmatimonadales bacterium]
MIAHVGHIFWNACAVFGLLAFVALCVIIAGDRAAARGWNPFE